MSTARTARAASLAALLALGAGLAACGTDSAAGPRTGGQPGAQLRALNLEAKSGWHAVFEAVYAYTDPVTSHVTRTVRFTIAQAGSKLLFRLGRSEAVDKGGGQDYFCHNARCVADGFFPSVQPPSSISWLRGLVDGSTFWSSTQGYPISAADLASRGITAAFSSGTYAKQPSSCVTITYRSGPDGYPLRSGLHKRQRWCLARDGVVDFWSSGRHQLVVTSFDSHPPAGVFELPPGDTVALPK